MNTTYEGKGYDGWSMSQNARDAYERGEMPLSKWTKTAIIKAIAEIDDKKAELAKKLSLEKLRHYALQQCGWHHTSKKFNRTNFYGLDEEFIENLTSNTIDEIMHEDDGLREMLANADREARERDRQIFEQTSPAAKDFLKLYIDGNGRLRFGTTFEHSQSGYLYVVGRKPTRTQHNEGIEKFFQVGEKRAGFDGKRYILQQWDGSKWVVEK